MQIYAASYLLPINGSPIEGGAVAVENGRIVAVGKLTDLRNKFPAEIQEFPGCVLMPGLVNAHTHLELTNFPLWIDNSNLDKSPLTYVDWIIQVIKVKRGIGFNELTCSLREGMKIALHSGTTMVGDIVSDRRLLPIYNETFLSGRVYLEFIGQNAQLYNPLLESIEADVLSLNKNFLPGLSPHSPFTVSKELLNSLLDKAGLYSTPVAMHLAESSEEVSLFRGASGAIADKLYPFVGWNEFTPSPIGITSTEWLDSLKTLSSNFLAIHGVHLSAKDIYSIRESGSSVVLAPRSNHYLGVGRAPAQIMKRIGIPLSLGTDSLASSPSLSLWDEMRFLLDVYPETFSPEDAIKMATIGGARAIKRDSDAGSLEVGKNADFLVVEIDPRKESTTIYERLLDDSRVHGVWSCGKYIFE